MVSETKGMPVLTALATALKTISPAAFLARVHQPRHKGVNASILVVAASLHLYIGGPMNSS